MIQIATNFANDYYDAIKGADTDERVGPQRAVSSGLISSSQMLFAVSLTLGIALITGLYLMQYGGLILLPIGLLCIVLAIAYTGGPYPLAYLGLGDIFVFIFFGLVAVMLTHFVQAGNISAAAFWTGCGCGLLATNILVVNNYRDMETDAKAKKLTSTVRLGRSFSLKQYALSVWAASLTAIPLYASGFAWPILLLLLLTVPGTMLLLKLKRSSPRECNPLLGESAKLLLAYAVIVMISAPF